MKKKTLSRITILTLVIFGLSFIIIGLSNHLESVNAKKNYIKTEAIITDIQRVYKDYGFTSRSFSETPYDVTFQYEVNGQTYTHVTHFKQKPIDISVGDTKIIYYNPSNPEVFASDDGISSSIMIFLFGFAPVVILFAFIKGDKKNKEKCKVLKGKRTKVDYENKRSRNRPFGNRK